jgi:hypothetical protein
LDQFINHAGEGGAGVDLDHGSIAQIEDCCAGEGELTIEGAGWPASTEEARIPEAEIMYVIEDAASKEDKDKLAIRRGEQKDAQTASSKRKEEKNDKPVWNYAHGNNRQENPVKCMATSKQRLKLGIECRSFPHPHEGNPESPQRISCRFRNGRQSQSTRRR